MSKQNTSNAVMATRKDSPDELDYYPTPPWATRALLEQLFGNYCPGMAFGGYHDGTVWEPACGEGFMSRPLSEHFYKVISTDVTNFSATFPQQGGVRYFLIPWDGEPIECDWVISNPPFILGQQFIERALQVAKVGVAMLLRMQFLEGGDRYDELFKDHPPSMIFVFCDRVAMHKGKIEKKQSTATAYCWFVWSLEHDDDTMIEESLGPRIHWLPNGTKLRLERDTDYPEWAARKPERPCPLFDDAPP